MESFRNVCHDITPKMLRTALRARDIATFGVGLVFVLAIARIQTRFLSHAGEAKSAADAAWRLRRREKATAPSDRPSFKRNAARVR